LALLDEHIDGKYEILEKLREGGMGAIYKVRHRLLDAVRVVKVIRPHMTSREEAGERFLREARVAIRLRHPNIAQLHDFAIGADGNAFIVMEFIDGSTLQEILKRHGPPPVALGIEIGRQALRALGYLHRKKIVHRDVSPDNLMLSRDADGGPLVKLIDLGIAKAFEDNGGGLTTTGIFLGKPRYAAPEQFNGAALDARSDLYSFGVVFYELLTGRTPIAGNDPASYMAGHLLRPPLDFAESDPAGRLPAELRETVLKMLAKDPDARSGSAEELVWALTMVQDRFPHPGPAEVEVLLHAPAPVAGGELPLPGSTQDRLDREFWMTRTPLPPPQAQTESAMTPLGASLLESVQTQRLPASGATSPGPDSTRHLPLLAEDAGRTRAVPFPSSDPAGTVASARQPSPPNLSVLDDMTWITTPGLKPAAAEAPVRPGLGGAQSVRSPGWKIALSAGALALLGAAGVFWWTQRPRVSSVPRGVLAPAPVVAPPVEISPTPAPPPMAKAEVRPAAPPPSVHTRPVPSPPVPSRTARAKAQREKRVVPEDPGLGGPLPVASDLPPMERGALIRRGMPNVQNPEPIDFPRYAYPAAARGTGLKVRVRVAVLVDENGKVVDALVRESDEPAMGFNETALEAARKVPYQPPTRDGIPGKMWTELIFEFAE
jgi:eukaryotic-like serine/threonine-protein kinase